MIGQKENIKRLRRLFKKNNLINIYGPCGTGKSFIVKQIAKEMKLKILNIDVDNLENILSNKTMESFFSIRRLILIDDIKFNKKIIKKYSNDLIVIISQDKIKYLGGIDIEFKRDSDDIILKDLKIDIPDKYLKRIVSQAKGDISYILSNVEFWKTDKCQKTKKDKNYDLYLSLDKTLQKQKNIFEKLVFYELHPELPDFLFENYLKTNNKNYGEMSESFSDSDLFIYTEYYPIFSVVKPSTYLYKNYINRPSFPKEWYIIKKEKSNSKLLKLTNIDRLDLEYYNISDLIKNMSNINLSNKKRKTSQNVKSNKRVKRELIESLENLKI